MEKITAGIYVDGDKVKCYACECQFPYTPGENVPQKHLELFPRCTTAQFEMDSIPKQFASFDSLKYEDERLATFIEWPSLNHALPEELAREGFFYLRTQDYCACVYCFTVVGKWKEDNKRRDKHKMQCPFITGKTAVGNVPMSHCNILNYLPFTNNLPFKPLPPPRVIKQRRQPPSTGSSIHRRVSTIRKRWRRPLLLPSLADSACHGHLTSLEDRIETFDGWPLSDYHKPQTMAEAGFYYLGVSDHVRCYACGYGLRNWQRGEVPLRQHAKWYPDCPFVSEHFSNTELMLLTIDYRRGWGATYDVSDQVLDILMQNDIVQYLRSAGVPESLLRLTYKNRLVRTGVPFFSIDNFSSELDLYCFKKRERNAMCRTLLPAARKEPAAPPPPNNCRICLPQQSESDATAVKPCTHKRNNYACRGCFQYQASVIFKPCGHRNLCRLCSFGVLKCTKCNSKVKAHQYAATQPHNCYVCNQFLIDVTFSPCEHTVCCQICSKKVNFCLLCDSLIEKRRYTLKPEVTRTKHPLILNLARWQ